MPRQHIPDFSKTVVIEAHGWVVPQRSAIRPAEVDPHATPTGRQHRAYDPRAHYMPPRRRLRDAQQGNPGLGRIPPPRHCTLDADYPQDDTAEAIVQDERDHLYRSQASEGS